MERIRRVTYDDVVQVGKSITKDTVYLLTNSRGEDDE